MERYFYRRGERVPVTEVDGVVAVQVADEQRQALLDGDPAGDERVRGLFGAPATGPRVTDAELDVDAEEARGLRESGWLLVRPVAGLTARGGDLPEAAEDVGTVFTQADGHVLIGTRSIVVQFDPELSEEEARARAAQRGLTIVRELRFAPNQFEVAAAAGEDVLEVANDLQESGETVFAEPSFVEYIGQRLRPGDPTYAQQWHLRNTGAAGGVAGADIAAEQAWDVTRGAGVTVAVIDNGFDVTHGDLSPALTAGCGFFDGSGTFRRTLTGYPDSDHGTFCAGMAAARQNTLDGSGSAPLADLLLVASRGDQVGTQATLARAVAYAADPRTEVATANPADGADVIVSSLGPNGANWALTSVLQNAIEFAAQTGREGRGTPIFWASSNGNVDIALDQVVSHRDVIAVGRSRRTDLEDNSARGEELDFLAPGVNVVSTASGGGTRTDTGTSFAAPLAAGVGALLLAVNPDLSADDVRTIMRRTCDKVGGVTYDAAGHNLDYGHGRVNAFRAVVHALSTVAERSGVDTDHDGDGLAEVPVVSPWGLGTLEYRAGGLTHLSMAPNGSRFGGWLLNTRDNRFPVLGDLDRDRRSELFVTSPWGIGVLDVSGGSYRGRMLAPNGTRFGGWLLNTADNRFGPVGDFDGDGRDEVLVTSPWGIALLKLTGRTFSTVVMARNGTRFGGWLLNTADNVFGPVGDFDGDGRDEVVVRSPWGIGVLKLSGTTFAPAMMAPNGTRFGGWLLNTADNWFGPAGDLDGDSRDELVIASPWGVGVLELSGGTLSAATMAPNGTRFGGWLLNTFDNRFRAAADLDGDSRDELFVTSPWGVGVLRLAGGSLTSVMLQPNGTRFGGWLLNTGDNAFRRFAPITRTGQAEVLVESPWGIGVLRLNGGTFDAPFMAPNGTRFGGWLLNTADNRF
ncbi:S8 family serine peptidase [Aquipuribacter nitratireducens]|uniref:S8 family serine peptidase n=1 Tax=Aquipuribacter nitratireducens TaxID=650104 RepID=A0ABW0GJQ7_9MICO